MPKKLQITPKALVGTILLGAAGLIASMDALNRVNLDRKRIPASKPFQSLPYREQKEEEVREQPPMIIWDSDTQIEHMLDDFLE